MFKKIINAFIPPSEEEEDEIERKESAASGDIRVVTSMEKRSPERSKRKDHSNLENDIIIKRPEKLEDAKTIIDELLAGNTVTVNISEISIDLSQRIMDMVAGYCYSNNCNMQAVSDDIVIFSHTLIK